MRVRNATLERLDGLIEAFVGAADPAPLTRHLTANSRLPGPRGNLELAHAFADAVAGYAGPPRRGLWDLCIALASVTPAAAPTNTPEEFLAFCGTVGLGAIGAAAPEFFGNALTHLRVSTGDPRWRTREAVAMGLQRMIGAHPREALAALSRWIVSDDWLAMRAVAAAVAEPALLKDRATARTAVRLHRAILRRVLGARVRTSEAFRTLRQALGYSCSVVLAALPEAERASVRLVAREWLRA